MTAREAAVVDYGAGNVATVGRALQALGYRSRLVRDPAALERADVVVLPGVGAFASAMAALEQAGLAPALRERAARGRPLVGICLGMQLLADASLEFGRTRGLGLIPGEVRPLGPGRWHIGWNTLRTLPGDRLLAPSDGGSLYFNHSFVFDAAPSHRIAEVHPRADGEPVAAAVRRGGVVGLQFHPEKSQQAGRALLRDVIEGLCHAH